MLFPRLFQGFFSFAFISFFLHSPLFKMASGKHTLLLLALVLVPLCVAQSAPIVGLPGLDYAINFAQYSGYVQVNTTRSLFFWYDLVCFLAFSSIVCSGGA
jgi:hypothetical protein